MFIYISTIRNVCWYMHMFVDTRRQSMKYIHKLIQYKQWYKWQWFENNILKRKKSQLNILARMKSYVFFTTIVMLRILCQLPVLFVFLTSSS